MVAPLRVYASDYLHIRIQFLDCTTLTLLRDGMQVKLLRCFFIVSIEPFNRSQVPLKAIDIRYISRRVL